MSNPRAVVLRSYDAPFQIEEIELGPLRSNEIRVRVVAAGLCHTDLLPRQKVVADHMLPLILGHEGAGVVEEVGSDVSSIAIGDHVLMSFDSCGDCLLCLEGKPAYCSQFRTLNLSARRGDGTTSALDREGRVVNNRWFAQSSLATHAIATERNSVVIDKSLPLDVLAPLGCGLQTGAGAVLNEMEVRPGQSIVVFGVGAVGLAAIMAAKIAGATDIVAVDLHQSRLDLAQELGATRVLRGDQEDLRQALPDGGPGLDFMLDTTALPEIIRSGISSLRAGGRAVLVGAGTRELSIHPSELTGVNIGYVLEGSASPQRFLPILIEHWRAGRFQIEKLTRSYALAEINDAEADMNAGRTIKPILIPPSN
jgi:aryl-alcohol dehydrogenase